MIKKIISKLINNNKKPIIDMHFSEVIGDGYTGGNITGINCLVAGEKEKSKFVEDALIFEQANVVKIELEMINGIGSIIESSQSIIGPFDKIFNVFELEGCDCVSQIQLFFNVIQNEVDYLVTTREGYNTSIVCIFLDQTNGSNELLTEVVKNFISGLGEQIGRHNIVINAVISDAILNPEIVGKWGCILSSKYGHILAGETVVLADS